jgi:putative sterol carrier protein
MTFHLKDQDWLAIAEGKLDPMKAFTQGKVKVTGDMMLAMRIPNLFPRK